VSANIPSGSLPGTFAAATGVPYTKWYNVHERYSLSDFKTEGYILVVLVVLALIHIAGSSRNRSKAKTWMRAHIASLQREFALVGFTPKPVSSSTVESDGLTSAASKGADGATLLERSLNNFVSYATGRQNVAFVDINLTLLKRYNPAIIFVENVLGFFFESMPPTTERLEATAYPFDGREASTVPATVPGATEIATKGFKSAYDNFVWAVVNKDCMKRLRDERYDVSLTATKDHAKLPVWTTVMSESAEITDALLTPELIAAIEQAGDLFEYLIISDQPIDRPTTIADAQSHKKRIFLSVLLPASESSYSQTLPLFDYFLRLPDVLVEKAHWRPEVQRKVKNVREEVVKKLQKTENEVKEEERLLEREKAKKLKRELELKGLSAKDQKKYLEREKEKSLRKSMKKGTVRG
jgi:hypothetical protein